MSDSTNTNTEPFKRWALDTARRLGTARNDEQFWNRYVILTNVVNFVERVEGRTIPYERLRKELEDPPEFDGAFRDDPARQCLHLLMCQIHLLRELPRCESYDAVSSFVGSIDFWCNRAGEILVDYRWN